MKKLYRGMMIGLLGLCGAFFVACQKDNSQIKIVDNSKTAKIAVLSDESDEKITITVNTSELTYPEARNNPMKGLQVINGSGENLKVVLTTDLADETGKIAYGKKTLQYEAIDGEGKKIVFTRDITVTQDNRPTFEKQSCDLFEIVADYDQREFFGIDLGYTELEAIVYNGTALTEEDYTIQLVNESVAMSPKAAFINGEFLGQLGAGTHTFEVVTSFGYNDYTLTITDNEKANFAFASALGENYIITDPEYVLPMVVNAENSYQAFDVEYTLLYGGQEVEGMSQEGQYVYRINVKKQGFEDETKDCSFYYLNAKHEEVFIDPVFSNQYMGQYTVTSGISTLSFVEDAERAYYLHNVKNAYSRPLNAFAIDLEVLKKAIERGMTSIALDVKVANQSEMSSVNVRFYTAGAVTWQSSAKTITKDGWTTIRVDFSEIQHWQDASLKAYTIDENGQVKLNITKFCITTQYGVGEDGTENVNYALMYSNIRIGETTAGLNGYFVNKEDNSAIKFEKGKATFIKNGVEEKILFVSAYQNGLIKLSESEDFASVISSGYSVSYADGTVVCNGVAYKLEMGSEDNPYIYDIYN